MKRIILIIPYFGTWPIWFDAFLQSCAGNPSIHWLCPTDCIIPEHYPANIQFFPITLKELNTHVNSVVGVDVPLSPRKFCDLKPAYGAVFKAQLVDYDFWGICDMDIIWGDIRKFITPDLLDNYDIISSRKGAISGHFTLFRNTPEINSLYTQLPNIKALYSVPEFKWTDEVILTAYLKQQTAIKVYWDNILLNQERGIDSHQDYYLDKWQWKGGKMLELVNGKVVNEVMYLHFINWKRTMRYNEVKYEDAAEAFYVSYTGMHSNLHSKFKCYQQHIKNKFNGYWVQEKRRKRKLRIKSLLKRIKHKLT